MDVAVYFNVHWDVLLQIVIALGRSTVPQYNALLAPCNAANPPSVCAIGDQAVCQQRDLPSVHHLLPLLVGRTGVAGSTGLGAQGVACSVYV